MQHSLQTRIKIHSLIDNFQSLLILSTSLAVANCGLLGQVSYADTGFYNHQQPRYSDATKVSYSSVSIPNFYATNPNPIYGQHQRQVNYNQQPTTGYAQYSPVIQQQQSNYIQSSSAVAGSPFVQQSYSAAPFIQNVQYPSQQAYTNLPQQQSYSYNNYGNSLGSSFEQIFQNQQQQPQQHQHYGVQQLLPVQNTYQSVQQLHPQVTPKPVLKTVSVQHFPALPVAQQVNNYAVQTKNAHHYPATVLANKAPANVAYQTSWTHNSITQQQPKQQQKQAFISSTSSKGSKSVFRTSFSDVAKPVQQPILAPVRQQAAAPAVRPAITYAAVAPITASVAVGHHSSATAAPQVITSGPYFTHTVIPSGQSSSVASLANNPINIPSSALVAPIHQNNNQQQFQQRVQQTQPQVQLQQTTTQQQQQQPQGQTAAFRSFSPSTSVSHAKFSGMGVQYEW